MSLLEYNECISEGDTVILYIQPTSIVPLEVIRMVKNKQGQLIENVFQTLYGALNVGSLIGKKYGSQVFLKKGYIYVLHLTPELWTVALPHRTQINYTPDISIILFQLDIRAGSTVLEAGTGSGSMSHALARVVGSSGKVYSFEFHKHRSEVAQKEFKKHGIGNIVTAYFRDVIKDGFGENTNQVADAIFLDLPEPWAVVPFTMAAYKPSGGRFASFSPCIEQVQKTCAALSQNGFVDINTAECVHRNHTVLTKRLFHPTGFTASLPDENSSVNEDKVVICRLPYSATVHTGYIVSASYPPPCLSAAALIADT